MYKFGLGKSSNQCWGVKSRVSRLTGNTGFFSRSYKHHFPIIIFLLQLTRFYRLHLEWRGRG